MVALVQCTSLGRLAVPSLLHILPGCIDVTDMDVTRSTIRSLHEVAICSKSLDLESKYACIVTNTLLEAASICVPISLNMHYMWEDQAS